MLDIYFIGVEAFEMLYKIHRDIWLVVRGRLVIIWVLGAGVVG